MLTIHGVSKQYGSKVLFTQGDASIGERSRVALVGPNGSGKSTLIKLILGEEAVDSGKIIKASHLLIGHLAQEVPRFERRTLLEEALRLDGRREGLITERRELEESLSQDPGSQASLERYGRVLEELESLDEYRLESRAKEVLEGMGFKSADWQRSLTEFSGGWLMRLALSKILLMAPDLLILDEPTNHLDLESLLWLEDFLRRFRGAMILISHDTEFLNRLVDEVLEIDQCSLVRYRGNLEAYAQQKQERLELLRAQYQGQQSKIADLEKFISRFRAKATKARQAQSRMKQLEKMERIELPEERATVRFRFPPAPHSGREVITARQANFAYPDRPVFKGLDWVIQRGTRVAIVGVNGAGKSTLLKLLAGQLQITSGELKKGHEVKIGYYSQHQADALDLKKTIQQELEDTAPHLEISRIRGIAGAFLFSGDAVQKRCGVLSGGEKARVALAKLLLSPSNFLLLDEPTNHLDVESRGVLLDALQDYEGTLCLVSHDRSFVAPLVDSVLEVVPGDTAATVVPWVGGYEDYLAKKMRDLEKSQQSRSLGRGAGAGVSSASGSSSSSYAPTAIAPSNNQKKNWEKERVALEETVSRLEIEQTQVSEQLSDPKIYEQKKECMELMTRQKKLHLQIEQNLKRWEEVCALIEASK